jgi:hypothetical protein
MISPIPFFAFSGVAGFLKDFQETDGNAPYSFDLKHDNRRKSSSI